jgi:subtilisin family serine protease
MKFSPFLFAVILCSTLFAVADPHIRMILEHPAFQSAEGLQSKFVQENFSVVDGKIDVIVSHKQGWTPPFNSKVYYDRNGLAIMNIEIEGLREMVDLPDVIWVEASSRCDPLCDVSVPATGAPSIWASPNGGTGEGVIVGVLDTGIDIYHSDFDDEHGNSRILAIWDLTVEGDVHPSGWDYGMFWTSDDIRDRLCTQEDYHGHGTHVTGTAAGNDPLFMGMAPGADIAFAKAGNYYFYSHNIANGFSWLTDFADEQGKPICINMSIGGGYGPHDGSLLYERVMGNHTGPGKIASISAGNSRGNNRHYQFDITELRSDTLRVVVNPYSSPGTLNDYLLISGWYGGGDSLAINVRSPRGRSYGPILPGDDAFFASDGDGLVWLDNSSFGLAPNGDRCFTFALCDAVESEPPAAGDWLIIYSGRGTVHGWLYAASISAYLFEEDVTNTHIVGPPGTMPEAITVASYATKNRWLNEYGDTSARDWIGLEELSSFSSPGPARGGNLKPDITAPGQLIGAARSSSGIFSGWWSTFDGEHTMMQGTSMSAPHVTGAIALLLQKDPTLTPDRVRSLLASTARVDSHVGSVPNYDWGAGKLDVGAAFEALSASSAKYLTAGETHGDTVFILLSDNFYTAIPHDVSEIRITANVISGNGNLKVRYGAPASFTAFDTTISVATGANEIVLNRSSALPVRGGDVYFRVECLAIVMPYTIKVEWYSDYSGNTIYRAVQTALDTVYLDFAVPPDASITDLSRWAVTAEEDSIGIVSASLEGARLTFSLAEEIEVGRIVRVYWSGISELFDSGFDQVETLWPIHEGDIYHDEVWADTAWPHYIGYMSVKASGSLKIMPGVKIFALDWTSRLIVEGQIEILGTPEQPVSFGVREPYDNWGGITFINSYSPRVLRNIVISHADTAINLARGNLQISGAEIRDVQTGILITGNANLTASQILFHSINNAGADFTALSGIWALKAGNVEIVNATFDSIYYAAVSVDTLSNLRVTNAIFNRCGAGVDVREMWPAELDYCCFHNNGVNTWGPIDIGANIIYGDPLFVGGAPFDYHLASGSSCIDAGDPAILDADGSRSDIGAFGGDYTNIAENGYDRPDKISLRVFPNPFNSICHIELGGLSAVIEIHDISGKLVKKVDLDKSSAWDGKDFHGIDVQSGVYLFRIEGQRESVKGVLLK